MTCFLLFSFLFSSSICANLGAVESNSEPTAAKITEKMVESPRVNGSIIVSSKLTRQNKTSLAPSESNASNASDFSSFARMYKGEDVDWQGYNFIGQLIMWDHTLKWTFECTGFMVTRQVMVTSSSCLDRWTGGWDDLQLRVNYNWGSVESKNDYGRWFRVFGVYRHPGFKGRNDTVDLALIKADIIPGADTVIDPISLPMPGEDAFLDKDDAKEFTTLGLGASLKGDKEFRLRKGTLKLYSDRCQSDWMISIDRTHQVCAKLDDFRYCPGDQGAPIFKITPRGWVVFALFSSSMYYCKDNNRMKNEIAIASRISAEVPWILAKIDNYTVDHGLRWLKRRWSTQPYPEDVINDDSMDVEVRVSG